SVSARKSYVPPRASFSTKSGRGPGSSITQPRKPVSSARSRASERSGASMRQPDAAAPSAAISMNAGSSRDTRAAPPVLAAPAILATLATHVTLATLLHVHSEPSSPAKISQQADRHREHATEYDRIPVRPAELRHVPRRRRVEVHAVHAGHEAERNEDRGDDRQHLHHLVHPVADDRHVR